MALLELTNYLLPYWPTSGRLLYFQGVDFDAAEGTLRSRLAKLNRKAEALREKKHSESNNESGSDLSRAETSKVRRICCLILRLN